MQAGTVFSLVQNNQPVEGCTISGQLFPGKQAEALLFSLAQGTSISAESYPQGRLYLGLAEELVLQDPEEQRQVGAGQVAFRKGGSLTKLLAPQAAIYAEIPIKEEKNMAMALDAGKVMKLADLVPYQAGKIVNRDLVDEAHMKFVVLSFAGGTALPEHAAPGQALIFALDGEAVITYEGKDHLIKAGENFVFAPGGLHAVRVEQGQQFKMALLLNL